MFLHDLGWGLLRRWYFVVLGIVLTACGALFLTEVVPPTYQGTARIVLLPPPSLVTPNGNPFLSLGGLEQALGVLSVRLSSSAVGQQILRGHPAATYVVEKDSMAPGPILLITAESENPESTLQVLDGVLKVLPENLESLQDQLRIPPSSRITAMTVVRESEPKPVFKSQLRAVLAGVAVGLSVTVLLTGFLDRLLSSRKNAARRRRPSGSGEEPIALPASTTIKNEHEARPRFRFGRPPSAELPAIDGQRPTPEFENQEPTTMASDK